MLRGVAILGVVVVHCSQSFPFGHPSANFALGLGRFGVQLFFLVSAFTMCLMWDRRAGEHRPIRRFYIRRVLRIAPLFWLAIPFYLVVGGAGSSYWAPRGVTVGDAILTATFLNGWWPSAINSIVPGGWSIAVEMAFYAVFPLLVTRLPRQAYAYLASAIGVYVGYVLLIQPVLRLLMEAVDPQGPVRDFLYLNPLSQAPVFFLGGALYFASEPRRRDWLMVVMWVAIAVALQAVGLERDPFVIVYLALAAIALITIRYRLRSAPLEALGRHSYAIYLIHFAIIAGLKALAPHAAGPWICVASIVATTGLSYVASLPIAWFAERPLHELAKTLTTDRPRAVGL